MGKGVFQEVMLVDIGQAVRARILALCQSENISVNQLCLLSGVTQSTVNNIISGRNRSTTVSTVKKLCDGLELPISEFFSGPIFDGLEQEIR